MADKTSIQLVSRFIEFAIPSLLDFPIDFQLFLSRVCSLVAIEVTALSQSSPANSSANSFTRATTDRLSLRRPASTSAPTSPIDQQQKTFEQVLKASFPDQDVVRRETKLGVGRFRVQTDPGYRLYEFHSLAKETAPEQVRMFLTDGLVKSRSTSGVLLSAGNVSGAQRLDLFGVPVSNNESIPVVILSSVPKDSDRMENLLKLADEIIKFLIKSDEHNPNRDSVAKIYTTMPKILHVITTLLNFIETQGANLRRSVGETDVLTSSSIKLPEYRALSLSGGRVAVSRPTVEGTITRVTTTPPRTVIARTVLTTGSNTSGIERKPSEPPALVVPGISRRTVTSVRGGTAITTERTVLTNQMRSMSMPKRFGKEGKATIQREIERFNQEYRV